MATRVFTPGCSISGMAENVSSAAGTVLVTPSSKVMMAETSAIASSSGVPTLT